MNKSSSTYLCVVINYTTVSSGASRIEYVGNIVGEPGLFFFDYKVSLEEEVSDPGHDLRYLTGELQYVAPPQSEDCVQSESTYRDTLCPQTVTEFGASWNSRSGSGPGLYNSMSVIHPFPNLTQPLPVSRFVGFFAFGEGVFEVEQWRFTSFLRTFFPDYNNSGVSSVSDDNVLINDLKSGAIACVPSSMLLNLVHLLFLLTILDFIVD